MNYNDHNQEINELAKNYYDSLDNLGGKRIAYKQKHNCKNRYHAIGSALTYLKKEIRNSIMPKDIKDIDMINSHPVILLNLCQKNKLSCNVLKNYVENRDLILDSFGDDRKSVKDMFLTILNGGFKEKYSDDNGINNYLKLLERDYRNTEIFLFKRQKLF